MLMNVFEGILIPFVGTTLGAACVFFMRKTLSKLLQRALAGFAAGIMVAASIWSLLIPAIKQSENMGTLSFVPAVVGFWIGILFLLALDHLIPHLHVGSDQAEGPKSKLGRTTGIAIQNFPEGAIISMPLRAEGESKGKAFLGGVLSGVVEPIGAVLTILVAQLVIPALPYFNFLRKQKGKLSPWKMNIFRFLPLSFLTIMLAVTFGSSFGDKFMYQHAMKAPDEMRELHKQFYAYMKKMKKCGCKAKKVQ